MKSWRQWPIEKIAKSDQSYPKSLKKINKPPAKLFMRGSRDDSIFKNCLAVVGARRITGYGEAVVEKLIPGLVRAGLTIVSGFMYGVDTQAHQACIKAGGKTIAVFGSGLDVLCPVSNSKLYTEILKNSGVVMSEYKRDTKPELWTFPQRNRIVAGLSKGVLVIEGGSKSGSLITARFAFQQGKKVMAVPGPINSSMSAGTNWLIRNGAVAVTSSKEILEDLELFSKTETVKGKKSTDINLTPMEKKIINELERETMAVDDICRKLNKNVVKIGPLLSLMSLKGLVEERNGKYRLVYTD